MLKPVRRLALLLIAATSTSAAAQNTKADSIHARLQMRHDVRALLDSAEKVRGTPGAERAYMWRAATLLAEFPDSLRAARVMHSVDDAASALEQVLKTFGMAMAVVRSTPPGSQVQFRRTYDTTATRFSVTANDSQTIAPAYYHVVCTWPGKQPAQAQKKDCTSHCNVECLPPSP